MNDESLAKEIQKDIYKIINEMKKTKSNSLYYNLATCLYFINEIIILKDLDIKYPKEFEFEWFKKNINKEKLAFKNKMVNAANINYDLDLKVANMSNYLFDRYLINEEYMHLRRFPFERSLELAIDFFKQFDNEIYNFFMDLISSPRFVLIDDGGNLEGWSLKRNYLVDYYTVIVPQYFISDFTTIIHETMHSYNQLITKNSTFDEHDKVTINALYEAPSFFIEHVGLDYLNNKYYDEKINKLRKIFDIELVHLIKEFKDALLCGSEDFETYLHKLTYVYGGVLSYHFYNNYLKNKDKTIKELKQFMIDYKTYDRDYMLNNYGLRLDRITNPQVLTKHMDKHLVRLNHE